jgi:hypothetical protein
MRSYQIPYKKYGVHSSDVVDEDYFFSPIYYVWISRKTGEPVSERRQRKIEADLGSDLEYRGIHSTKILYYYWGWVPARRAAELRNQEIQRQITTLNAAGERLRYSNRAAPKPFRVHSSRELDCFYEHDPVSNYWIFRPTGRIVDPSTHLEIERELARKKDLNYLRFKDTVIYCNKEEWEFVTVRDSQARAVKGCRNKRRPTVEAAPSSLSMHGKSHARSEVGHDEHRHVTRKPSGMHSACHEEGDEQLTVERAGRERTAHEELSSQMKTKKSMMQQAGSAASLVGSVRDTARKQEGDDVVKPNQRKV